LIEIEQLAIDTAGQLKEITQALNSFYYKSSFDKTNRSSAIVSCLGLDRAKNSGKS